MHKMEMIQRESQNENLHKPEKIARWSESIKPKSNNVNANQLACVYFKGRICGNGALFGETSKIKMGSMQQRICSDSIDKLMQKKVSHDRSHFNFNATKRFMNCMSMSKSSY